MKGCGGREEADDGRIRNDKGGDLERVGRFGPWEERSPAIVAELQVLDPDVIALQETWRDEERTQARSLAEELGYPHSAHEDVEQVGGIAIVSRLPLMAKRRLDLQYSGHREWPGTALIAGVEADFGTFDVACVVEYGTIFRVLGSSASSTGRLLAYRVIVDELTTSDRDIPPVLLGDLNATPYDEDMRVLTGKVPEAGVGLVFTDAWEMLHGPEGGWTFDLRDNPWLQGTRPVAATGSTTCWPPCPPDSPEVGVSRTPVASA